MPSHDFRLRRWAAWLRPALVVAGVGIYAQVREPTGEPANLPQTQRSDVRALTWNLRRLGDPKVAHDEARIRDTVRTLAPALVAVQEVYSEAAVARVMPPGRIRLSRHGGHGEQRLGFWWDTTQLRARGPAQELARVSLGGHLRPALAQRFETLRPPNTGLEFWAITVHLKARPAGLPLRKRQWEILRSWIDDLTTREPSKPARPILLLGDFNATGDQAAGSPTRSPAQERAQLAQTFGGAGFELIASPSPCSAFWEGPIRDRVLEPSLLDLMWVRGPLAIEARGPAAHCKTHSCQSFRSSPAYPDLDYEGISDHCPVVVDFKKSDDFALNN